MQQYRNSVNEGYLNSPMFKLKNGSNTGYLNSIMYRYSKGQLTQQQAKVQWDELMEKETGEIQTVLGNTKDNIKQTSEETRTSLLEQQVKSINGILEQRAKSLRVVSDLRTEYFGEGLSFDRLIPDLGIINVFLNEEWLGFEPPPTLIQGHTMVPLRFLSEAFGAG